MVWLLCGYYRTGGIIVKWFCLRVQSQAIQARRAHMQSESLYAELASGGELIQRLAAGVSADDARCKPNAEAWSVLEVICHLVDEEREDFRQRLDILLHRPADPWPPIDPVGWVRARRYNERELPAMLEQLRAERRQSLEWLRSLPSPDWEAAVTTGAFTLKAGDLLS